MRAPRARTWIGSSWSGCRPDPPSRTAARRSAGARNSTTTRRSRPGSKSVDPPVRSGGEGAALALERPLAADPAAFPLRQAAPDAELLAVAQGVLEALHPDLTAPAHRLGLLGGGTPLGEEEVGIDP